MNGQIVKPWMPGVFFVWALTVIACGCQGQQNMTPDFNSWAPGYGARISPPATGRGAYGSPDPYYKNSKGQTSVSRNGDDERYADRRESDRDDRGREGEYPTSQASFEQDDPIRSGGMPKSGEPKRFESDPNLVEMTDLPESSFGTQSTRTAATIRSPGNRTKRTPYKDYDHGYDEDYRAASTDDGRWRRRD